MNAHRIATLAFATVAGLFLAACGADATTSTAANDGTTTVEVIMTDMAFTPTVVQMKAGDTIRFHFRNDGQAIHEAVIGDEAFQEEHAAEMASTATDGHSMGHDTEESAPLVVLPGETGEMTFTATASGRLIIGCHQPGHWDAGMKATLDVV